MVQSSYCAHAMNLGKCSLRVIFYWSMYVVLFLIFSSAHLSFVAFHHQLSLVAPARLNILPFLTTDSSVGFHSS